VKEERPTQAERSGEGLGTRIANRFAGIGFTEEIPEWRGYFVRPPKFLNAARGRVRTRSLRNK
jgi:hypothetical protein